MIAETLAFGRAAERGNVTFGGVVRSEWIKFRTLPSSWWALAAAAAAMVGFGALIGAITGDRAVSDPWDLTPAAMMRGYYFSQLLIGVLGVFIVSGEYATAMIRATLAAVPNRTTVVAAKALVFTAVSLAAMTGSSLVAFLVSQALIDPAYSIGVNDEGVWQAVVGSGAYLTVVGLLGGALGWILRSTPAAISTLVGVLLVAPLMLRAVPSDWASDLARVLPSELGVALSSAVPPPAGLGAATAALGLTVWLCVAFAGASLALRRRDA